MTVEELPIENESLTKSTIFVRKLPKNATSQELEKYFQDIGPIKACFVVTDKNQPGQNKGYGFVQFSFADDAQKALQVATTQKFRNQFTLQLELAKHRQRRSNKEDDQYSEDKIQEEPKITAPNERAVPAKSSASKKSKSHRDVTYLRSVLIRGLPHDLAKKQLYKKVRKYGDVEEVIFPVVVATPPKNPEVEEGTSLQEPVSIKGHARVVFKKATGARKCVQSLDKHIFKGNNLRSIMMPSPVECKKQFRLVVRNLPFKCTEHHLAEIFGTDRFLLDIVLPKGQERSENNSFVNKGFAFLTFSSKEEADDVVSKMNMARIPGFNRMIAIDFVLPKDEFIEQELNQNDEAESDHETMKGDDEEMNDEEVAGSESENDESHNVAPENAEDEIEEEESTEDNEDKAEEVDEDVSPRSHYSTEQQLTKTLFIRNVAYEATETDLFEKFREYGRIKYCALTREPETGRLRGTAFVQFNDENSVERVLEKAKQADVICSKSLLSIQNPNLVPETTSGFWIHGRQLIISRAVDREQAQIKTKEKEEEGVRHLHLLKEGYIRPDSQAAAAMKPAELARRQASFQERKAKLAKHTHLILSLTRLSIRNLPKNMNENDLKKLAVTSAQQWLDEQRDDAATGSLGRSEREEWEKLVAKYPEPANYRAKAKQAKVIRDTQVALLPQNGENAEAKAVAKSKGYGFVEFTHHLHALGCLRKLNNNPDILDGSRRLIVEFAIENTLILKKREQRIHHRVQREPTTQSDPKKQFTKPDQKDKKETSGKNIQRKPKITEPVNTKPAISKTANTEKPQKRKRSESQSVPKVTSKKVHTEKKVRAENIDKKTTDTQSKQKKSQSLKRSAEDLKLDSMINRYQQKFNDPMVQNRASRWFE